MSKNSLLKLTIILLTLSVCIPNVPGFAQTSTPGGVKKLQDLTAGNIEFTWNPATNTPSLIRGQIPTSTLQSSSQTSNDALAVSFLNAYADVFSIQNVGKELVMAQQEHDDLDMEHITFNQVYQGVEVYNAGIKIHFLGKSQAIVAVSSSFVPQISLATITAQIDSAQALAVAQRALPNGTSTVSPKLFIYVGSGSASGTAATLVWMVEMWDDAIPAHNIYIVDATKGAILGVLDRLYTGRDRKTYDAQHGTSLPGTLKRSEDSNLVNDKDVDNAHTFAGTTYDYFWNTYGRDSFDGKGTTIISTVHYGTGYKNAFWNGKQMVYGDSFVVKDVVAHELTHAVTTYSANLEYKWQSGALNESFSDIFGAMVDRDDWLMGEDLPSNALGGREAIRDLSNPPRFGQPDHTKNWVKTCSDEQGVHTNSGITNKAYYNIATAITRDKAERIFYRALTVYLRATSSLEDARSAALRAAQDFYGSDSAEYNAVLAGFNAVGLDGKWNPPSNDCSCAVTATLSGATEAVNALNIATTLYRTRDELMTSNTTGIRYREIYERYTGRVTYLLLLNPYLKTQGISVLQAVTPGLSLLMDEHGQESVVSQKTVDETISFLKQLAADDRAHGGGELADTVEREMARIDWQHLVGLTYEEAWTYIQKQASRYVLFAPIVIN